MTLLNTFASLKMTEHSNLTPMIDIKFNVASEQYSLAANQIRQNIQKMQQRTPSLAYEHAGIQFLEMIHNSILDMDHKYHNEYMIGLFELIKKNLSMANLNNELLSFQAYSQDLNKQDSKNALIDFMKTLNKKDFKHKQAVILFVAQMLATHDYLVSLKDQYL
jgi:hypothetical protein